MSSRNLLASTPVACLLAVGILGIAPVADAASVGPSPLKLGKSVGNDVVEIKYRGRGSRFYRTIGPSYIYYDYPYYYSRGFYPTHIRPGFIYYGQPYLSYYKSRHHGGYGRKTLKD